MKTLMRLAFTASLALAGTAHAGGGGLSGGATEFTQRMNNAELGSVVGNTARQVTIQADSYAQLMRQTQTQLSQLESLVRNGTPLSGYQWTNFLGAVERIKQASRVTYGLSGTVQGLDQRFTQAFPGYDAALLAQLKATGQSEQTFGERASNSQRAYQESVESQLRMIELSSEQMDRDAAELEQLRSEGGQLEAIQTANRISALTAQQLMSLRSLTAAQASSQTAWRGYDEARRAQALMELETARDAAARREQAEARAILQQRQDELRNSWANRNAP